MRRILDWLPVWLVAVGLMLAIVSTFGLAQARQVPAPRPVPNVEWQAKRGYQPDVVLLKKTMPTEWQVCAERYDTDQVDCRPIDEVRKFLRERAPAYKKYAK